MTETTLRRTLPEAYTIGLGGGAYLGLVGSGDGTTYAVAYTGGEWTELVGSTTAFDPVESTPIYQPVFTANRYVLVVPDFDALLVWDLDTGDVATYAPPAGWSVLGVGVLDGAVYWVERETDEHGSGPYAYDVRLRTSGFDLVGPSTVCTRSVSVSGGESVDSPLGTGAVVGVLFTAAAAIVSWSWVDQVAEDQGVVQVRLPLSGATAQADVAAPVGELGLPTASTYAVAVNRSGLDDGSILLQSPDDVSGAPVGRWPLTAAYALSNPVNVGLTSDNAAAVVYGFADDGPTLIRAPLSATVIPTERATVASYGEVGAPAYLYPRD